MFQIKHQKLDNPLTLLITITTIILISPWTRSGSATSITIESTNSAHPVEYDCARVKFRTENFITCLCVEGIWALSITKINQPQTWKILGGRSKSKEKCYQLGEWVGRAERISESITVPSLKKLSATKFLLTNKEDWEVRIRDSSPDPEEVDDGEGKVVKVCLPGHGLSHYCIYDLAKSEKLKLSLQPKIKLTSLGEGDFKPGCGLDSIILKEDECGDIFPLQNTTDTDPDEGVQLSGSSCSLIPPMPPLHRVKRQTPAAPGAAPPEDAHLLDEDFVDETLDKATKVGHPDMMASVVGYVKVAVAERLDADKPKKKRRTTNSRQTPTQTLLQLCKDVAQDWLLGVLTVISQSCSAINGDTFNIAMNSFLTQQIDGNHMKEPYMSFTAYQRTLQALERCRAEARPIMFYNASVPFCETQLPRTTASVIKRHGQNVTLKLMPRYAAGDILFYDPIIEMVWKMFVTAQSLCFSYFSDYFNDHHTFTVAMIPFFTNKIQDIWMLPPPMDMTKTPPVALLIDPALPVSYETDKTWYGNILGHAGKLLDDMDRCYEASRIPSGNNPSHYYPWFTKRPPQDKNNEWMQRKKRSVDSFSPGIAGNMMDDNFIGSARGVCDNGGPRTL